MALLDGAAPGHLAGLQLLAQELDGGTPLERGVLLNLREEGRVPDATRGAFHAALLASTGSAVDRVGAACRVGPCCLPVGGAVPSAWSSYSTLEKLVRRGFVPTPLVRTRPPRRLPLSRPYNTDAAGGSRCFWITTARGADPDDLRDRLGLDTVAANEALYRLDLAVNAPRPAHVPTALDAAAKPPWRHPPPGHAEPWGMTRDLRDDRPAEPELLIHAAPGDPRFVSLVGEIARQPSDDYLKKRIP
jgi:hypothetical protein